MLLKSNGHDAAILNFEATKSSPAPCDDFSFIGMFENIAPFHFFYSGGSNPPASIYPVSLTDASSIILPYTGTTVAEASEMLEDLLILIEEEQPSQFLFELVKTYYMEKATREESNSPELLQVLFKHISHWLMAGDSDFISRFNLSSTPKIAPGEATLDNSTAEAPHAANASNLLSSPREGTSFSQALKYYLLNNVSGVQCLHELMRRIFNLALSHSNQIRLVLEMITRWLEKSSPTTPRFLLFPLNEPISIRTDTAGNDVIVIHSNEGEESEILNAYLRVYLKFTFLIFDGRASIGFAEQQKSIYDSALEFLHYVASEKYCRLENSTWDCLMDGLIGIIQSHLMQPNKYFIISSPAMADEFCKHLSAIILFVWIQGAPNRPEKWKLLQGYLSAVTRWHHLVIQWSVSVVS